MYPDYKTRSKQRSRSRKPTSTSTRKKRLNKATGLSAMAALDNHTQKAHRLDQKKNNLKDVTHKY